MRGLRERFDGPIIWAQPTPGADHRLALYDQILRDLRLPVLWRRPTYRPRPPPGFPRHYLGGVHNPDVLVIEQRSGIDAAGWGGILSNGAKARGIEAATR